MAEEAEDLGEGGLNLHTILAGLRRRRTLVAISFALALIPGIAVPLLLPAQYQATATISVQRKAEALELGPDVLPGVPLQFGRELMRALITVVSSDSVLGRVVDQLPAGEMAGGLGIGRAVRRFVGASEPAAPSADQFRKARIEALRDRLELVEGGGGSVLVISVRAEDPTSAAYLANAVAQAYLDHERDRREAASRSVVSWLSQKVLEVRDQVRRGEEHLADLDKKSGRPDRSARSTDSLTEMTTELRAAKLELAAVQERIAELRPRETSTRREPDPEVRERLASTRAALEEARLRYTPTHPEVTRLESIVQSLEQKAAEGGPATAAPDPEAARELRSLEADNARLRARVRVLQDSLNTAEQAADDVESVAEYNRVERELAVDRQSLDVLLKRQQETMLATATDQGPAQVLDRAVPPVAPIWPERPKALALGIALAAAFAIGLGVLREMLDQSLYEPQAIAKALGCQYLGSIPIVADGGPAEYQATASSGTPGAESYRILRTALLFAAGTSRLERLLITSGVAGEGKTTVSANLASSFAAAGRRVLLVDADLRRPRLDRVLALSRAPGLAEILSGSSTLGDAVRRPIGLGFDCLPSGDPPENPSELLGSTAFATLLNEAEEHYDIILIDSPVLFAVADALVLARQVPTVLIVNRPGSYPKHAYAEIQGGLERAGARILGVVLNRIDARNPYQYPSYQMSPYVNKPGAKSRRAKA